MQARGLKVSTACAVGLVALSSFWYVVEPSAVTFMDDGPYGSVPYHQETGGLRLHSRVNLKRFGRVAYVLESRLSEKEDSSIFVLSDRTGSAVWTRVPVKPDGALGPVEFGQSYIAWYGGWQVAIKPALQERGYLYLGPLGGFRFFNHSW